MKRFLPVAGAVLVIIGAIWFLQGINVLPGSFMTGQARWAWIGGGCVTIGVFFAGSCEVVLNGGTCVYRAEIDLA